MIIYTLYLMLLFYRKHFFSTQKYALPFYTFFTAATELEWKSAETSYRNYLFNIHNKHQNTISAAAISFHFFFSGGRSLMLYRWATMHQASPRSSARILGNLSSARARVNRADLPSAGLYSASKDILHARHICSHASASRYSEEKQSSLLPRIQRTVAFFRDLRALVGAYTYGYIPEACERERKILWVDAACGYTQCT